MPQTFRIYGHGDKSKDGFPTGDNHKSLRDFIAGGVFKEFRGRYRYNQTYFADKMILSQDGLAFGHFDVGSDEEPTPDDLQEYPITKRVFLVNQSTRYETAVRLNDLGMHVKQRGLEISEDRFNEILDRAGKTQTFFPKDGSNVRLCRICFNSNGWRRPNGTADETGVSYYAENGFGHEEWLFNYEWCLNGYKYGYLQPVKKLIAEFEGQTFTLLLYTKLAGRTFLAGRISEVYIPTSDELQSAVDQMVSKGWLDQMRSDVESLVNGKVGALSHIEPGLIANVRFQPKDVTLYDPMPEFRPDSKPSKAKHYVPLHSNGEELPTRAIAATANTREESQYLRAAQQAMLVDPAHTRLQNRLYEWLCKKYGKDAVGYEEKNEKGFVDLRLAIDGTVTFFEIKMDSLAKRCIRNALGQLFEYANYPNTIKAHKWVVVGDAPATPDDLSYLQHLRTMYGIPLYYAKFDWESETLGDFLG